MSAQIEEKQNMLNNTVPIYIYLALFALYRITEYCIMHRSGTLKNTPRRDWTAYLIIIPFYLVVISPIVEYQYFDQDLSIVSMLMGGIFYIAAAFIRGKAHLDLRGGFSMRLEHIRTDRFIKTGLYKYIRHPLYLGNLCLFVACPLFLSSFYSWIFTVLGLLGILFRIRIEERFMCVAYQGYRDYMKKTSALIPGVF